MEDLKLAILIDADNISPKYVKVILDEAATFGVAACKRIYGDWSDVRLKSWKDALLNNSIIPIQQYSYTTGKNAKMPVVAAVPLAVYCVAHFSAVAATVASFAFIVFSIMLLWYAVLLLRAYNTTRVKK